MPTFQGQVTEEEVLHLIAYIQSLGRARRRCRTMPRPRRWARRGFAESKEDAKK